MYDEQYYEKCLLIDGRSVCCGFAASKNITSLGIKHKIFKKHLVLRHIKRNIYNVENEK